MQTATQDDDIKVEKGEPTDKFGQDVADLVNLLNEVAFKYFEHNKGGVYTSALTTQFVYLVSQFQPEKRQALIDKVLSTATKIQKLHAAQADA